MKTPVDQSTFEEYAKEHERCTGVAVQEFRTEKGLSPAHVANAANVSVRWLKKLETNELARSCSIERLNRVAYAMGLDLLDLYKRAGEMTGPAPHIEKDVQNER